MKGCYSPMDYLNTFVKCSDCKYTFSSDGCAEFRNQNGFQITVERGGTR